MILIDCGNSQLKAQHWNNDRMQASFQSRYCANWNDRLLQWLGTLSASDCYLSSVLDRKRQSLLDQCLLQYFDTRVTRFKTQASRLGVTNGYREPEKLGVDRWLALIEVAATVDGDCMVIDAGSAITLDLLTRGGLHLGGAILPGINTTRERFKQIFSHIDFGDPAIGQTTKPGGSTEQAIHIDYAEDTIQYLVRLVDEWQQCFENESEILITGGDAGQIQDILGQGNRILPDLVFRGMYRLAQT